MISMRTMGVSLAALAVACTHAAPTTPSATPQIDPKWAVVWNARRPLPASPTLADVLCLDARQQLQLDAVVDPNAPTATSIDKTTMRVCARGTCKDVHRAAAAGAVDEHPLTNGVYVASLVDDRTYVYRVAEDRMLFRLENPFAEDAAEFSCGVSGFLGDAILAFGHDCGGPIAVPWLLDGASGRGIAKASFGADAITNGFVHVAHLGGTRWAVVPTNEENSCLANILDARTGAVLESVTCDPSPMRVVGDKTYPLIVPRCP